MSRTFVSDRLGSRRRALALLAGLAAWPGVAAAAAETRLTPEQSRAFRGWMTFIVQQQFNQGPNPRWVHRDCAGLVRFAVAEALRDHDSRWLKANGIGLTRLPPELQLTPSQQGLRNQWRRADGSTAAYVSALELVQANTRLVARDCNLAQAGDLLFFDQGDEQHLMVWMGRYIGYHTGTVKPGDPGLRAITLRQLMEWKDTRWQPLVQNPNFAGVFRLTFLTG